MKLWTRIIARINHHRPSVRARIKAQLTQPPAPLERER